MLMRPKHSLVRLLTPKASGVHTDPVREHQDKAPVSHPASGANTHRSDGVSAFENSVKAIEVRNCAASGP